MAELASVLVASTRPRGNIVRHRWRSASTILRASSAETGPTSSCSSCTCCPLGLALSGPVHKPEELAIESSSASFNRISSFITSIPDSAPSLLRNTTLIARSMPAPCSAPPPPSSASKSHWETVHLGPGGAAEFHSPDPPSAVESYCASSASVRMRSSSALATLPNWRMCFSRNAFACACSSARCSRSRRALSV